VTLNLYGGNLEKPTSREKHLIIYFMKNLRKILAISIIIAIFVACDKNEVPFEEPTPVAVDFESLYSQTDYNLDLRDFALAVNEAVNTNKSFRKLVKEEALKMFNDDYDVIFSHVLDKQISQNDREISVNAPNRAKANYTVRDLFEDSYFALAEKEKVSEKTMMAVKTSFDLTGSGMHKSRGLALLDALTTEYPNLQVSVPIHIEQLEDENYIPPVIFIPGDHIDGITPDYPGFFRDSLMTVSAIREPLNAHIVIGLNEWMGFYNEPETNVPSTPTGLTGQVNEYGLFLTWSIPTSTNSGNASGYKVYRAVGTSASFGAPYAVITGGINKFFTDDNVTFGENYAYTVTAFNEVGESDASTVFSITPARPAAATSFTVNPSGANKAHLTWKFNSTDYTGAVKLSKRLYYEEDNFNFFATPQISANTYTEYGVGSGQKLEYKIERETGLGTSEAVYDLMYMPYRDVSKKSSVYITQVMCTDFRKIEAWGRGKPDYKIKVLRARNGGSATEEVASPEFKGSKDDNKWQTVNKLITSDWQPGFDGTTWYDVLSFYVMEHDGGSWDKIDFTVKSAEKILTGVNNYDEAKQSPQRAAAYVDPATVAVVALVVGEAISIITKWVKSDDDKVGQTYLNYYDDPNSTLTIPMPKGGYFHIKFGDKPI
jgi:Fibronectin type III domain.